MIQGISNTLGSLPVAIGCTAVGLFIGRRFCTAAFHKAGSIGANLIKSKSASEWSEASKESLALAKIHGIRDLTAATGLIAIGLASGFSQEKALPKEEPRYIQKYGVPAGMAFIAGSIVWTLKNCFQSIFTRKDTLAIFDTYRDGKVFARTGKYT